MGMSRTHRAPAQAAIHDERGSDSPVNRGSYVEGRRLMEQELGFRPRYTLATGVRAGAEWLRARSLSFRAGKEPRGRARRATSGEQPRLSFTVMVAPLSSTSELPLATYLVRARKP